MEWLAVLPAVLPKKGAAPKVVFRCANALYQLLIRKQFQFSFLDVLTPQYLTLRLTKPSI